MAALASYILGTWLRFVSSQVVMQIRMIYSPCSFTANQPLKCRPPLLEEKKRSFAVNIHWPPAHSPGSSLDPTDKVRWIYATTYTLSPRHRCSFATALGPSNFHSTYFLIRDCWHGHARNRVADATCSSSKIKPVQKGNSRWLRRSPTAFKCDDV